MIVSKSLDGFTGTELVEFRAGLDAANRTIPTPSFAAAVLAHTKMDRSVGFDDTLDSNQVVLDKILAAFASDIQVSFKIVNPTIKMNLYHTVAFEIGGLIVFNRRRFGGEDTPALADTVAHEAMHAIGYGHPTPRTRPTSVPYGVGAIVEELLRGAV